MLEFRYDTSERFEKKLFAHIKSINPRATVDYNYHGNPPFSFEVGQRPVQHAGNADFVTGETGVWGFSALGVGLNAEFYRASTPGKPFQVAMQRGVRMYHDQTTRPLNDIRWELMTLLAHGAFVTIVDKTAFDGSLDPVAYERFRECFAEVQTEAMLISVTSPSTTWESTSAAARATGSVGKTPADIFRAFKVRTERACWSICSSASCLTRMQRWKPCGSFRWSSCRTRRSYRRGKSSCSRSTYDKAAT